MALNFWACCATERHSSAEDAFTDVTRTMRTVRSDDALSSVHHRRQQTSSAVGEPSSSDDDTKSVRSISTVTSGWGSSHLPTVCSHLGIQAGSGELAASANAQSAVVRRRRKWWKQDVALLMVPQAKHRSSVPLLGIDSPGLIWDDGDDPPVSTTRQSPRTANERTILQRAQTRSSSV